MTDLYLNLQLFAEGAEGGDGGEAVAAPEAPQKATWEQLMEDPDYRQAHNDGVQRAIQSRFASANAAKTRLADMQPAMRLMASRYNIAPGEDGTIDTAALNAAIVGDRSFFEEMAEREGIHDVETAQRVFQERTELEAFRAEKAAGERAAQEQADSQARQAFADELSRAAEAFKAVVPGFDIQAEMANPETSEFFRSVLLQSKRQTGNFDFMRAYTAAHPEEMTAQAMGYGAQRATKAAVDTIAAGQMRPREEASGSPVGVATTPGRMSKAERQSIKERVLRGEKVIF